ncbi:hypothetical protein [uncultured Thiodictyon sp.]|uniref:hypothetical protein n=1 Tax=uncultured Thiodictyon sp. TaxID=1846217 RepID=UPI0025E689AD|nr:hypothetical protein [uncultured Thiodictyon sp.]
MIDSTHTPFVLLVDLSERELAARTAARERHRRLVIVEQTRERSGGLSDAQRQELAELERGLLTEWVIDPFYLAVLAAYLQTTVDKIDGKTAYRHVHGFLGSQRDANGGSALTDNEREIAAISGLLQLDNIVEPGTRDFVRRVVEAQGEYRQARALFDKVFSGLGEKFRVLLESQITRGVVDQEVTAKEITASGIDGTKTSPRTFVLTGLDPVYAISAKTVAAVVRRLVADGVSANDPWLANRIDNAFDTQTGVVTGAAPSSLEIRLPDLEEPVDVEIIAANLHATQAIYFSYMLEEMRLFQVVDQIVELFRQGMLPLGKGKAGDYLYNYYKKANERINETERRELYMRAFGSPGGDPDASLPNRDFNDLWLRFVSAVSSFSRQLTVERLLRNSVPMAVTQEQVRKSGRDLAANLSLHGYGIAYFAATELQQTIIEFRDLLQNPEIRGAFGARDMWQVIDQVNATYLGSNRNTQRYRTQARAGAVIIRWLANNGRKLSGGYGIDAISVDALTSPQLRSLGSANPTVDPTDWDLVQACEQWLAVGGVQDQSVEQYSQPIESPVTTSKPIEMPQFARDALQSAGISLPGM